MSLKKKLLDLRNNGGALLATNYYNYETLQGILQAFKNQRKPVILQLSESSIEYLGLRTSVQLGRSLLHEFEVEGWIHLDHGSSLEMIKRCLDEGFDSVMIDASQRSFADNVRVSSEAVKISEPYSANVEAELGYIPKLGQSHTLEYTKPEEAMRFVEETGVDALAIAVGTAHGFYHDTPRVKLDIIEKINEVTKAALVLHGSSGVPDSQITESIKRGINKINFATEIKNTFMKSLKEILGSNDNIDLRQVFPGAIKKVTALITERIKVVYGD